MRMDAVPAAVKILVLMGHVFVHQVYVLQGMIAGRIHAGISMGAAHVFLHRQAVYPGCAFARQTAAVKIAEMTAAWGLAALVALAQLVVQGNVLLARRTVK